MPARSALTTTKIKSSFALRRFKRPGMSVSWRFAGAGIVCVALAVLAGCKKEAPQASIRPSQVHSITRELSRAAANVVRDHAAIEAKLQFDGVHPSHTDHIIVAFKSAGSSQSRRELITRLIQSLDRAATAGQLTRDPPSGTDADLNLTYRRVGLPTHSVEIIGRPPTVAVAPSAPFPRTTGAPRLAIILDDLGNDRGVADSIFAMHYPLTLSVLPNQPHSADIAADAHRHGYEVMLHLPMQSVANEKPEPQELRPGMTAANVQTLVDEFLQGVPGAVGVNNHQGSQSTADTALMEELMPILRDRNVFYVDSRTTAATVAYDTARQLGVHCAYRNVPFLDDIAEVGPVRKQLQLALRDAGQRGEAVAIGHPHPATLQAMREILPEARTQGVKLVFVSEIVH